jgi:hypothetical protein
MSESNGHEYEDRERFWDLLCDTETVQTLMICGAIVFGVIFIVTASVGYGLVKHYGYIMYGYEQVPSPGCDGPLWQKKGTN